MVSLYSLILVQVFTDLYALVYRHKFNNNILIRNDTCIKLSKLFPIKLFVSTEMKRDRDNLEQKLQEHQDKHNLEREGIRETGRTLADLRQRVKQLENETFATKNTISSKELVISKKMQLILELEESESKLREERRDLFSKNRELVYENDELSQTIDILQARIKRLNQSQMRADGNT